MYNYYSDKHYTIVRHISLKDLVLTYSHRIDAVIIMNYMLITILKQLLLTITRSVSRLLSI